MKINKSDKIYLSLMIILFISCYIITQSIFLKFYGCYNLPFGKSDIDNYINFYYDKSDYIHYFFTFSMSTLLNYINIFGSDYNYEKFLMLFIPMFAWFYLPFTMFCFSLSYFENIKKAIVSTLLLFFCTYFIFGYLIVGVLAQYYSVGFFLLLGTVIFNGIRHGFYFRTWFGIFLFSLLMFLSHPYSFVVLCLFIITYCLLSYKKDLIFISIILFIFGIQWLGLDILNYTIFGNHYVQTTPITNLFVFTSPLLIMIFLQHFFDKRLYFISRYTFILLLFAIFSHQGRLLPNVQPLLVLCCTQILFDFNLNKIDKIYRYLLYYFIICACLFYFDYLFGYFVSGLIGEFTGVETIINRDMDTSCLLNFIS